MYTQCSIQRSCADSSNFYGQAKHTATHSHLAPSIAGLTLSVGSRHPLLTELLIVVFAVEGVLIIDSDSDRLTDCGEFVDGDWQLLVTDGPEFSADCCLSMSG